MALFPAIDAAAEPDGTSIAVRTVPSQVTGSGIRQAIGDHLVAIGPESQRKGYLWLFLPGTGGRPDQYTQLATSAAQDGLHAINLAYINNQAVNRICQGIAGTCAEDARTEIITGKDTSTAVRVDEANSIVNRLTALLRYLDGAFPGEGWGRYLQDGSPRWELIRVGGHSQGGGHAAFLGKLFNLDRVVLFSATEPAAWTARPGATPADRYYGFVHAQEPLFVPVSRSWQNLGIPGAVRDVDGGDYRGAHKLSTTLEPCAGDPASNGYYHNCHVVDGYTPLREDGTPVFGAVWDYLFGS